MLSARIEREQFWIDAMAATDPRRGYNRAAIAGVSYGGTGHVKTADERARIAANQPRKPDPVGSLCPKGHVKTGQYRRPGKTQRIRCQECERTASRERNRAKRGIPPEYPLRKHFNRRKGGCRGQESSPEY